MRIITENKEGEKSADHDHKHLVCPANSPDFKPRKLIIPPVGVSPSVDDGRKDEETLVS